MLLNSVCPSCGASEIVEFYKVESVPIHSCVMFSSKNEAVEFSRGKIVLGCCRKCGFIFNLVFNSSLLKYSMSYEDQQSFSPTFNTFSRELATNLIKKYDIHNKRVLEIGCGKGDFLSLMCEIGDNSGVGIDPSYIKGRINGKSNRLMFIKDYYSERYSDYHGDLVICRHTLEHISNTAEFVRTMRRAMGDRLETIVFFEVPDVTRILSEVAFWDIYYEHCSYFSPGSLARLFRLCNFKIIELSRGFRDQYLLVEAKPVRKTSSKLHELEENVEKEIKNMKYFYAGHLDKLKQWKKRLQKFHVDGKRIVIWGSGSKCVSFLTTLQVKDEIDYVVDINPYRHGKFLPSTGKEIMPPEILKKSKPDVILVMNPIYLNEITEMVNEMGVTTEVVPLE